MKKITVAIDGYSSCGKSTMARDLAAAVGYIYIDSGAMYRAVTLHALQEGLFGSDGLDEEALRKAIDRLTITFARDTTSGRMQTYLNQINVEEAIRRMEIAERVSSIAALGFVRRAMVEQQQAMGRQKGIVMDGRDIGTVVFPDAELKVFVTADPRIRAQRRLDELTARGEAASFDEVLSNIIERDRIDTTRAESPLTQAADALILDNSAMTVTEQQAWLLDKFTQAVARQSV